MNKYIDAEKLKSEIKLRREKLCERYLDVSEDANLEYDILSEILNIIESHQQEQLDKSECVLIHKKYSKAYRIVSDNARLKNSNGEWIDCVIYAPLYENKFEVFAREKNSFYSEFEKIK